MKRSVGVGWLHGRTSLRDERRTAAGDPPMTRATVVMTAPGLLATLLAVTPVGAETPTTTRAPGPTVAALLEDNAETLLPLLTNPTGDPGEGFVERAEVF